MTGRIRRVALLLLAAGTSEARAQADLFASDSVLAFTIRTDLRALKRDRDTADAPWRPGVLQLGEAAVPVRLRTRGLFRLRHCDLPPLRLRFTADSARGTPFEAARRPKLGSYCMDRDDYEQLVLNEYVVYKLYALFTPLSYRARLARVTYEQAPGEGRPVTRYGLLTEDPERFAGRVAGQPVERQGIRQSQIHRDDAVVIGLFQYFIGNTDWSVPGLHNIELFRMDSVARAVAFDFDWSGAVNAPYARPDSRINARNVRDRVYRGLCFTVEEVEPALVRFEALKDSVAAIYRAVPDLNARNTERTMEWYEEFYRDIRDRRQFVRRVIEPTCFRN